MNDESTSHTPQEHGPEADKSRENEPEHPEDAVPPVRRREVESPQSTDVRPVGGDRPTTPSDDVQPVGGHRPITQPVEQPQFGIASILMSMTLVGVLLAILRWIPGLGIVLLIAFTPAFMRSAIQGMREKALGKRLSFERKFVVFLSSLGFVIAVALSAGAAFYSVCWGGFLLVASIGDVYQGLFFGLVVGVIGQIAYTVWFIIWLVRHRDDDRNRLGDVGFILSWFGFAVVESAFILSMDDTHFIYLPDALPFSVFALPGAICSFIAVSRPKCFLASCGVGTSVATAGIVFFVLGWEHLLLDPSGTAQKPILLILLFSAAAAAVVISLGVYLGVKRMSPSSG